MTAGDKADAAVFYGGVVEQKLAGNLEVGGEEGPEDRVLVEAVGAVVGRFGEDLVVVEFDVGAHEVGDDVDDFGMRDVRPHNVVVDGEVVELANGEDLIFDFALSLAKYLLQLDARVGDMVSRTGRNEVAVLGQRTHFVRREHIFDTDVTVQSELSYLIVCKYSGHVRKTISEIRSEISDLRKWLGSVCFFSGIGDRTSDR